MAQGARLLWSSGATVLNMWPPGQLRRKEQKMRGAEFDVPGLGMAGSASTGMQVALTTLQKGHV